MLEVCGALLSRPDPAWSFSPLSGAGAALTGGRFNRKDEPALYLSLDVMTSFGECTQGFTKRLQPLTMCEYDVDCDGIVDLRDDAARAAEGVDRGDLGSAWLTFQLAGKQAPSWLVADRAKAAGHSGMLVPSFVPGATDANLNLVLWLWGPDLPHKVNVHDPSGRLPQNQLSWPRFAAPRPGKPFSEGPALPPKAPATSRPHQGRPDGPQAPR